MQPQNRMVIDFKPASEPPDARRIHLHMTPCHQIQDHSPTGQGRLETRWDGKTGTSFSLNETDETKAMRAL
jgi:hypothetical protein